MIKEKIKAGSTFLFSLIRILLFGLGLTGAALIAMAIWFWTQLHDFSWTEIAFILFGVFELLLVLLACSAQTSTGKLKLFLYILSVLFIIELTVSIVIFATGEKIIDQIVQKTGAYDELEQLKKYLIYVDLVVVVTLVVELLLILFVKCYIGSLRQKNREYDYKFVDDEGNKLTVQQKQMNDTNTIKQKYAQKREEMNQKYGKVGS